MCNTTSLWCIVLISLNFLTLKRIDVFPFSFQFPLMFLKFQANQSPDGSISSVTLLQQIVSLWVLDLILPEVFSPHLRWQHNFLLLVRTSLCHLYLSSKWRALTSIRSSLSISGPFSTVLLTLPKEESGSCTLPPRRRSCVLNSSNPRTLYWYNFQRDKRGGS